MRSRGKLFVLIALLAPPAAESARGELVDRIVAIVDREVVTLSEAEQASAIARARTAEAPGLASVVERLIEARLIEREVARFAGDPVSADVVEEAVREVRSSFATEPEFLAMLEGAGMSLEELRSELGRQLSIARYLERRFRALSFVTEEQVRAYYREEIVPRAAGGAPPELSELAESIRRLLEEKAFNDRVEQWIQGLKDGARIHRYVW